MIGDRLRPGDAFPVDVLRRLETLRGRPVGLPDGDRLLHLQLRRFAGCPICDLHLRSISARLDEIGAAGIDETAVFHSSVAELARYEDELPMVAVADPDRRLYSALGMERSIRAFLHPGMIIRLPRVVMEMMHGVEEGRLPRINPTGGELGLPADVLIDRDGSVVDIHYGAHASDQWTVDQLLALARR